eukprot:TRINITY_DN1357_c0_g1_i3.p1 TRINITY_DN1357_c0_g1~~TRINITY_DN1357_c0_g1_i3.p1  ORF type:complete len:193 (+),score=35.56 TRINITY_DN1357_c0_g1_i3:103-681(+)
MYLGLVGQETYPLARQNADGIMGMAWPMANYQDQGISLLSFPMSLYRDGVSNGMFAFMLGNDDPPHPNIGRTYPPSSLTLGGWDPRYANESAIHWHAVADESLWYLAIDDVKMNGESFGMCPERYMCYAVVDTGSSDIILGVGAFNRIVDEINSVAGAQCHQDDADQYRKCSPLSLSLSLSLSLFLSLSSAR